VAVVALSHGGPSALLFAALHPDRVTSLALISAGVASSTDASQQQANRQGDALTWIFQRIAAIRTPTLIVHAKDDTLQHTLMRTRDGAGAPFGRRMPS
jgi:pimeloyl-ACP methyl ester carboxylesterase